VNALIACCALAVVLAAPAARAAETVYRCGPEGREYSSSPCPGGQALQVDDGRTAAQRKQAQAAARREAKLADSLSRERVAREKAERKGAAGIGAAPPRPASAPASGAKKKRRAPTAGAAADGTKR